MLRMVIGNKASGTQAVPAPTPPPSAPPPPPRPAYQAPDLLPLSGPLARRPLFPRIEWFLAGLGVAVGGILWIVRSGPGYEPLMAVPFLLLGIALLWAQWKGDAHLNAMFLRRQVNEAFSLALRRKRWDWLRVHVPLVTTFEDLQTAFRAAIGPVAGLLSLVSDRANTFIPVALKESAYRNAHAAMEEIVGVALRVALLGHFVQPTPGLLDDVKIIMERLGDVGRRATAVQDALAKLTLGATADTLAEARELLGALNWMATEQHRLESDLLGAARRETQSS